MRIASKQCNDPTASTQVMSSCDSFTENAWRPDLCSTCQRSKVEHETPPTGPRSWRRRSEPDPNHAIAGVRISSIAAKFQGKEARSGSLTETGKGRDDLKHVQKTATSHENKTSKDKQPKTANTTSRLNGSRSADLLDVSSSSLQSYSSSPASSAPPSKPLSTTITVNKKTAVTSSSLSSASPTVQSSSSSLISSTASSKSSPKTVLSSAPQSSSSKSAIASTNSTQHHHNHHHHHNHNHNHHPKPLVTKSGTAGTTAGTDSGSGTSKAPPSHTSATTTSTVTTATTTITATNTTTTTTTSTTAASLSNKAANHNKPHASAKPNQHKPVTSSKSVSEATNQIPAKPGTRNTTSATGSSITTTTTTTTTTAAGVTSNTSTKPKPNPNRLVHDQTSSGRKSTNVSSSLSSSSSSSSSQLKSAKPIPVLKKSESVDTDRAVSSRSSSTRRRVSIADNEPEVIGTDGGLDNIKLDDEIIIEDIDDSAVDVIYPSLTEEEKKFALLALGNTVWNSDTRNLQVGIESEKRYCREFEDIEVESLWKVGRFKSLVACDIVTSGKRRLSGTFPQVSSGKIKAPSSSKISLQSIGKASGSNMRKSSTGESGGNKLQDSTHHHSGGGGSSGLERIKSSASSSATSGHSSMTSLSSDSDGRGHSYGSSTGSADSGVEIATAADSSQSASTSSGGSKERPLSYTLGDITDCLYETVDEAITSSSSEHHTKSKVKVERTVSDDANRGRESSKERPFIKARPSKVASLPEKSSSSADSDEMTTSMSSFPEKLEKLDLSLTDSTFEGFQAIALLNDVLRDYGDLNESSTDDVINDNAKESSAAVAKKDAPKGGKKSSAFEARMASVAANLDLTKQQRGKRQAPRPPVSPPPEPTMSQGVSPKKVVNQPDPVFKMVPMGKPIVTLPPQNDVPKPAKSQAPAGLEEFATPDSPEVSSPKNFGDGGKTNKKGITGFFKNILRRGKDSQESFESMNPDIQLNSKSDAKDSGSSVNNGGSLDEGDNNISANLSPPAAERKLGSKFSQQSKYLVMPPNATSSPSKKTSDNANIPSEEMASSDSSTANPFSNGTKTSSDSTTAHGPQPSMSATPQAHVNASVTSPAVSSSPPTQRKSSKGLASPKMMLKRATAKFSPPTSRHKTIDNNKEPTNPGAEMTPASAVATASSVTSSSAAPPPTTAAVSSKPYPAPKPALPALTKPPSSTLSTPSSTTSSSAASASTASATSASKDVTASKDAPNVIKRRAKSPKRNAPPVPPSRIAGAMPARAMDSKANPDLASELERRLSKGTAEHQLSGTGTLNRNELRDSTRRSMPIPPPSPPNKDKSSIGRSSSPSPPVSPIRETDHSLPSSPSSPTTFDFPSNPQWSGGSNSTIDEEMPKFTEKIELPTVANPGRKGILGKLSAVNRKTKAPQPPSSVKRAKSITESSTLPRGDKKNKRINVADISGPVMVTDITNNPILENRRNTISLGDDPSFALASLPIAAQAAAGSSGEKGEFDEFDFPVLSPLGSLENLYESILPKQEGTINFHYYDPPTSPKIICPNIPADGYLEPVPPASLQAAASTSSATATTNNPEVSTTTAAIVSNLDSTVSASSSLMATNAVPAGCSSTDTAGVVPSMSSSSSSFASTSSLSASSAMTNASVVKSPSKSDPLVRKNKTSKSLDNVFDSNDTKTSSHTSSESNSAENSGGSLPDSFVQSKFIREPNHSNVGVGFVEPELTEERRTLLASQPIYEEIPNGFDEEVKEEEAMPKERTNKEEVGKKKKKGKTKGSESHHIRPKKPGESTMTASFHGVALPGMNPPKTSETAMSKSQIWSQQPPPPPFPPPSTTTASSSSSSTSTTVAGGTLPGSPSKLGRHASSSSLFSNTTIMSASLTSAMLPPPPPPPDQLSIPYTTRSISRETVSSESDIQSNCSTLPRPRAAPRRKAKRPDTAGSDQYVSMNKPNLQVSLSEDKLRDMLSRLSTITFHSLQEIYAQCEKVLSVDQMSVPNPHQLKWSDFDIYGQPLHASGRCVVYNAKFTTTGSPCQLMILHSRPATEMCHTSHPSLLRPAAVFADTIPFSFLTGDFIKTSQLLQNSIYDSTQARCFVAVGAFDIMESLDSHLSLLRETMASDPNSYLGVILTAALQLLSAMSHCLDQGFSVTETDYNDVFLITRTDLRGKVVAFLPHQRSLDVPQGEAMCNFLDGLLADAFGHSDDEDKDENDVDDLDEEEEEDADRIISSPKKVIAKLRSMLEAKRVESLGHVRTAIEYLLWGPSRSDLPLSPGGRASHSNSTTTGTGGGTSKEQELYIWLEVQRTQTVGKLACSFGGLGGGVTLEEFYTLKFLLKTSALCLTESLRRLVR